MDNPSIYSGDTYPNTLSRTLSLNACSLLPTFSYFQICQQRGNFTQSDSLVLLSFLLNLSAMWHSTHPTLCYIPQHHPAEPTRCTWHPPHALLGLMHPLTQISFSTTPSSPVFHCVVGLIQTPKVCKDGPPYTSHGRSSAFPRTIRSLPRPHCAVQ